MGKRFVCDNGALSGEFFARVSFKHTKSDEAENWKEIVRQGLSIIDHAPDNLHRFAECLRALKRAEMTDAEAARGLAAVPDDRGLDQGPDREPLRGPRGAHAVRAVQRGDERVLAPGEDDGGRLRQQRRLYNRPSGLLATTPSLTVRITDRSNVSGR